MPKRKCKHDCPEEIWRDEVFDIQDGKLLRMVGMLNYYCTGCKSLLRRERESTENG